MHRMIMGIALSVVLGHISLVAAETPPTDNSTRTSDEDTEASGRETSGTSESSGALDTDTIAPLLESDQQFFPEPGQCQFKTSTYHPPGFPENGLEDYVYWRMVQTESGATLGVAARRYYHNPNGEHQAKWLGMVRNGEWWWSMYPPGPVERGDSPHLEHARRGWMLFQALESSFSDGTLMEQFRVDSIERTERSGEEAAIVTIRPARGCTIEWAHLSVTRLQITALLYEDDETRAPRAIDVSITTPSGETHELSAGMFPEPAETCVTSDSQPPWLRTHGGFASELLEEAREDASN